MEWLSAIRKSIDYIEENLKCGVTAEDAANEVHISPYIFCKGFAVMTGYSVSEYIRGRRLFLASLDLRNTKKSVLDIALDYGYDTPESFTKAFSRFHGSTPSAVRGGAPFNIFLPLKIQITIHGGDQMECRIKKMSGMKLIGFEKLFSEENSYEEVPKFWDEVMGRYVTALIDGKEPESAIEKAVKECGVGEYGVCVDDVGGGSFRYLIAGEYMGGEVPEGMTLYEFPDCDWAVFDCFGPLPEKLQELNTKIFGEWLPGNAEFEISGNATVEWYDMGDTKSDDYHSAIWLPVRRK